MGKVGMSFKVPKLKELKGVKGLKGFKGLKGLKRLKGVSALIATVLLIAFTIAVGGIISVWLTQFTQTQTDIVGKESESQILCGTGQVQFSNVKFCSTNNYLSGEIANTGSIGLGNITFTILYTNASREVRYFENRGGTLFNLTSCCGNFTMIPTDKFAFNISIGGSNYDILRITTNCTTTRVSDEVSASKNEIIQAC